MSLIDDFIESSEAVHGRAPAIYSDSIARQNGHAAGFDGLDDGRLKNGYVSTGLGEVEQPMFALDYIEYSPKAKLVYMAVSNNILVAALDTFRILRINLDSPEEVEEIEITRKPGDDRIAGIFFDPTGRHLIISTDHGENYYLYEKWERTKNLTKFKGVTVSSVAWNKQATPVDPSTKEILIGARNGLVYETCLEPPSEYFRRAERYFTQVYSIHESTMPITGLHFEQFPTDNRKYFVMATTFTRIHQFIGTIGDGGSSKSSSGFADASERGDKAVFDSLFSKAGANSVFQELPGELSHSEMHFFSRFHDVKQQGVAQTFAWLTGPGIYHGDLVFGSQNAGDNVIDNVQLLQYPTTTASADDGRQLASDIPISVALTEFHFILLYRDRVRAICQLNDQIVYEEMIPPRDHDERVLGMTADPIKQTFWIYSTTSMYELGITDEERDVWQFYLEKKQYEIALKFCKDAAQKDRVYTAQARDYFGQRRFQASAKHFAESTVPFEEVALKFVEKEETEALCIYLRNKLKRFQHNEHMQKTMVSTWIVEVYLSKLNALDDSAASVECTSNGHAVNGTVPEAVLVNDEEKEDVEKEFNTFLDTYCKHLDKTTTYMLMAKHGRHEALLYYASLIGDYDRVIGHWIMEKKWKKALEVLSRQGIAESIYKYSPVLIANEPCDTVTVWMRQSNNLNPRQLIPSLLRYDHAKVSGKVPQNQAIRYLSFVVTSLGNTDPAIHNFLLTLYAAQPSRDESALLMFLKNEGSEMHYNLDYALRLCSQHGRMQSCVHIYSQLGLYEEAVHLALKHDDIELAQINANKPEDDDALRKKLALRIVKYMIQDKKDINAALAFLNENDLLKIEDVLPLFPDFVLIDGFKDDICTALEDYTAQIEDLKSEMEEATKNADSIRLDIRELKSRFALVSVAESCTICDQRLVRRAFYIFPCQHAFHSDCLTRRVTEFLPMSHKRRLVSIQDQLAREQRRPEAMAAQAAPGAAARIMNAAADNLRGVIFSTDAAAAATTAATDSRAHEVSLTRLEQLGEELDDIVAGECVLCGDTMIKSIDKAFIDDDDARHAAAAWAI